MGTGVPAEGAEHLPVWPYASEVLVVQCFNPGYCLFKAMEGSPVSLLQSRYVNFKHQDQMVVLELDGVPNFPLEF